MDHEVLSDELDPAQERRLRYLLSIEPLPGPHPDLTPRVVARARRRQARQLMSVVVIVLMLAGAAGLMHVQNDGHAERVPATRPSPSAPTTTTNAWTLAQACDYWRNAAAPGVAAWKGIRAARTKQATGASSWLPVRDAFGVYASAMRKVGRQVASPPQPWPAQLDPWVQPIVTFYLSQASWADSVHRAATETEFNRLYDADPSLTSTDLYEESGTSVERACGLKATPSPA